MTISILIASRARERPLRVTVRSIFAARCPPDTDVQLVLVASGCTETANRMRQLATEAPAWLRVEVASHQLRGKSRALNLGLTRCEGDVVVFTDDDVAVDAGWLEGVRSAFDDSTLDAVQGKVIVSPATIPCWWSEHCASLMAATVYLDAKPDLPLEELNGCNMAVRRRAAEVAGAFNEAMGPGMTPLSTGEDAEWTRRLARTGAKMRYWPAMTVRHELPAARTTAWAMLLRSYESGRAHGACCSMSARVQIGASLVRMMKNSLRLMTFLLSAEWPQAFERCLGLARQFGILRGLTLRRLASMPGECGSINSA